MSEFRLVIFTCLLHLITFSVIARQNVSLKQVVRLDLSESGGGLSYSDGKKKFQLVREKGAWKSYQIKDSLTRMFIKNVSQKLIVDLLKIINTKDTSIKIELFNIQQQEMTVAFDNLIRTDFLKDAGITPRQKIVFLEALEDKNRMELMLRRQLIPLFIDDKTSYKITITTKSGKAMVISALSFANIYNLPWNIDEKQLYNPDISRIYASLIGNDLFEKQNKDALYHRLMLHIFWSEFQTPFAWTNLKEAFPAVVDKLTGTLHIDRCTKTDHGWTASFSSLLLPEHLSIAGGFRRAELILPEMKQLENRLATLRQQNHHLFERLKQIPDFRAQAIVTENSSDQDPDPMMLAQLKARYKKIVSLRFEQVTFIEVYRVASVARGTWVDKWILLPDDTLIVIPCKRPDGIPDGTALVYDKNGDQLKTLTDLQLPF